MSAAARRRSRTGRVLKWGGTALCVLIVGLAAGSYSRTISWHDATLRYRVAAYRGGVFFRDHGESPVAYLDKAHLDALRMVEANIGTDFESDPLYQAVKREGEIWYQISRADRQRWLEYRDERCWSRARWWSPCCWFGGPSSTRTVGVPLWVPFILVAVPTVILWRLDRRIPTGHCQRCGYNLTGNVSGICPECGTPVTSG